MHLPKFKSGVFHIGVLILVVFALMAAFVIGSYAKNKDPKRPLDALLNLLNNNSTNTNTATNQNKIAISFPFAIQSTQVDDKHDTLGIDHESKVSGDITGFMANVDHSSELNGNGTFSIFGADHKSTVRGNVKAEGDVNVNHASVLNGNTLAKNINIGDYSTISGNTVAQKVTCAHDLNGALTGHVSGGVTVSSARNTNCISNPSVNANISGFTFQGASSIPPIDENVWKQAAAAGGVVDCNANPKDCRISGGNLGPKMFINGPVRLENNANVTLTGPVYIAQSGDSGFRMDNNVTLSMASSCQAGTAIVVNGEIRIGDGAKITASGSPKNYILFVSRGGHNPQIIAHAHYSDVSIEAILYQLGSAKSSGVDVSGSTEAGHKVNFTGSIVSEGIVTIDHLATITHGADLNPASFATTCQPASNNQVSRTPGSAQPVETPKVELPTTPPPSSNTSREKGPCSPVGDVNGDNKVNNDDAQAILNFAADSRSPLAYKGRADINDDGKVDAKDALLIQQYVAGSLNIFARCNRQPLPN